MDMCIFWAIKMEDNGLLQYQFTEISMKGSAPPETHPPKGC